MSEETLYTPSEWGARYHKTIADEVFGAGAAGPGKALCINTPVLTPEGHKKLKDIKVGDYVFSMAGNPVKVIADTGHFIDRNCYLVNVHGERFICDEEHQWILDDGTVSNAKRIYERTKGRKKPFYLMESSVPQFHEHHLHLPPFLFAFILIRGLTGDPTVFDATKSELYRFTNGKYVNEKDASLGLWYISDSLSAHIFSNWVKENGRIIPNEYLYSSEKNMTEFLRGIYYALGKKRYLFDTDSILYKQIRILIRNLNITLFDTPNEDTTKSFFKMFEYHSFGYVKRTKRRAPSFYITPTRTVPTKCIQVEGDGSYLIGFSNVVTHNSMVLLHDPLQQVHIEHVRCQYGQSGDPSVIPESWEQDHPGITELIKNNPLDWGDSVGWVLQVMRLMPNHRQNIMRAQKIFPKIDPGVKWNEKEKFFKFSSGLRYEFGHCKDRNDHINYLSLEFTYIGFDELIKILETQYDAIRARLRTSDPVLKYFLRCCSMSNPRLAASKGEDIVVDDPYWVKRRFVDPYPSGNVLLRKTVTRRGGEKEYITRIYLPATLYDNPDKEFVRDYEKRLLGMPQHIRDCYLYGKWDGVIGSHFKDDWNPDIHICNKFKIPSHWPIFRSMDWGFSSNGVIHYYALDTDNDILYVFYEITFKKKDAEYIATNVIKPFEIRNKLWNEKKNESKLNDSVGGGPCDRQLWEERGSSYKTKYMQMADNGVSWQKADQRSREANCQTFQERLRGHEENTRPPKIIFFKNCMMTTKTIPALETDPNNLEQPVKGGQDHWYDSITYGCRFALNKELVPPDYKRDETPEINNERWY